MLLRFLLDKEQEGKTHIQFEIINSAIVSFFSFGYNYPKL